MNEKHFLSAFFSLVFISVFTLLPAERIEVNTLAALQQAINNAKPGDQIVMADGVYTTTESIIIKNSGTEYNKITIYSEKTGGTEINGTNGFVIQAPSSWIVISGFKFTHNTGTCNIQSGATHCTFTRNIFECTAVNAGTKPYLNVSGDDNEVSYNTFRNKKDEGQMLSIQGPGGDKMAKRVWVHHNYFHDFVPPGKNNCSAIQIGLSGRSMDSAFCLIEYNLFIRTEGENEGAICHKSCNNIIRFNTFGERSEECSIRHGNKSQVYGNFFINNTGLRFSGDDHLIYSNYFQGCSKAIVCTNGDGEVKEGSKLTCHDRSDRVTVTYNTIVDCKSNYEMPGRENGLGATNITFSDNLIIGGQPVSIRGKYLNPIWKDNILTKTTGGDMPADGYKISDITRHPTFFIDAPAGGAYATIPNSLKPLTISDVGPEAHYRP